MPNPNVGPAMAQSQNLTFEGRGEAELQLEELRRMEGGMAAVQALIKKRRFSRAADVFLCLFRCTSDGRQGSEVCGAQTEFERGILV